MEWLNPPSPKALPDCAEAFVIHVFPFSACIGLYSVEVHGSSPVAGLNLGESENEFLDIITSVLVLHLRAQVMLDFLCNHIHQDSRLETIAQHPFEFRRKMFYIHRPLVHLVHTVPKWFCSGVG